MFNPQFTGYRDENGRELSHGGYGKYHKPPQWMKDLIKHEVTHKKTNESPNSN